MPKNEALTGEQYVVVTYTDKKERLTEPMSYPEAYATWERKHKRSKFRIAIRKV